ncbi:MAG TPA: phosphatase PAP2 family protein [Acidimicrobiales bacterium]|nr:phosphatase PAP2 family protein [Acidimicrobiales bacterium]
MTAPDSAGEPAKPIKSSRASRETMRCLLEELNTLDSAIYDAVASTPTPTLDVVMTRISDAATYSRLWLLITTALALAGGDRGRRTVVPGVTAIGGTSFLVDLLAKHLSPRKRPQRSPANTGRQARMPTSSSFPSGHAASAFAFATTVTAEFPELSLPMYALATAVCASRLHMGVHYPSDVIAGAVLGLTLGMAVRESSPQLNRYFAAWRREHPRACPHDHERWNIRPAFT